MEAELRVPEADLEESVVVSELCSSKERQWRDCVAVPRDAYGGIGGGCHCQTTVPRMKIDLVAKRERN